MWNVVGMISYTLRCPEDHRFDSWFQSAAAFDTLLRGGHLACPVCGSGKIEKSLMAPAVRPARSAARGPAAPGVPVADAEQALAALRRHVEENSEYVGMNFVTEARAIYEGEAPERPIYGEAKADEAKKLIEDGVPVAPLPFLPVRKTH